MPKSRYCSKNKAFSLIELIIAIGILSAGIVFILQALSFSARSSGLSTDMTDALLLATDRMQMLELAESFGLKDLVPEKEISGKFSLQYTLSPLESNTAISQAELSVSWQRMGKEENILLPTYFRK